MNDNVNNEIINKYISKTKRFTDVNEMLDALKKYKDLVEKTKTLSVVDKYCMQEEINNLRTQLMYGITIDSSFLNALKVNILRLCELFGVDTRVIKEKIDGPYLTISPLKEAFDGLLCNYGSFISIDISYIEYDKDGKFVKFNEPEPNFLAHTLTHELLHTISNKGFAFLDSFSEGLTDYFAHKVSKAANITSKNYDYFVRIFYMFGLMIGDKALFEDYVANIYEMPHLHKFLNSLNISNEEIVSLKKEMDTLLESKYKKTISEEQIKESEGRINKFIFERIIMPFCAYDTAKANEMMNKVFSNSEETSKDMCNIQVGQPHDIIIIK